MKRIENTARNIFLMDDEATFGTTEDQNEHHQIEQAQTAPIDSIPNTVIAHPLRGLLTSALSLIASRPELSMPDLSLELFHDKQLSDNETDDLVQYDDLIPLYEEQGGEVDTFSTAVAVLDSITDSLRGGEDVTQDDGVKTPLFLSAFKSRFLR